MHCKDCKHRDEGGYCLNDFAVDESPARQDADRDAMLIYDYSEGGGFWVGPNFDCVHFEGKDAGITP